MNATKKAVNKCNIKSEFFLVDSEKLRCKKIFLSVSDRNLFNILHTNDSGFTINNSNVS